MTNRHVLCALAVFLSVVMLSGCGRSDAGSSSAASSSGSLTTWDKSEQEAIDATTAELQKHWVKASDGWIAAFNSGNQFAPNFVRQLRELTVVNVAPRDLAESDKLNGVEWSGELKFKTTPCREAGEAGPLMGDNGASGSRVKGRWSQWVDLTPESVFAQKINGKWQVQQQTMLMQGTPPTPADYQMAGVKP